jgi:hypothetical protein
MKKPFVLVLFVLCAIPALAQDHPVSALPATSCGPDKIQFDVKTEKHQPFESLTDPSKALVFVSEQVRLDPDELPVNLATIRVGLDGQWVGANHGKSYFSFLVDPGEHEICANWQTTWLKIARLASETSLTSAASLTAEAGKVYYFQTTVDERSHRPPAVSIEVVDPAEGRILVADSPHSNSRTKK